MLAFSEPSLFYVWAPERDSVLGLSKVVINFILTAGIAMFMHFAETRLAPQVFLSDDAMLGLHSIHTIRTLEAVRPPSYSMPTVDNAKDRVFESQPPALHKIQPSITAGEQKIRPGLNRPSGHLEIIKSYLAEIFVFLSLVVTFIYHSLETVLLRSSGNTSPDIQDLAITSTSQVPLGEETPPNGSGDPGRNQRQPGDNWRGFGNFLSKFDLNDFRNRFVPRGGPPPPPPPPPPAFGSSMQHGDKWAPIFDWIYILLLLPIFEFIFKHCLGRRRKGLKKRDTEALKKAGTCPNVIPLRERRPMAGTATTTVRWILPNPNNRTLNGSPHRALYPVNLTRWFLKLLFFLCTLALTFLRPVLVLMLAISAWYYLPDVILPLVLNVTTSAGESNSADATPEVSLPLRGDSGDVGKTRENVTGSKTCSGTSRTTNVNSAHLEHLAL